MSYLDTPRIHFSGSFFADPSTVNNDDTNYPASKLKLNEAWNPMGHHFFFFQSCKVKTAVSTAGSPLAADPLVGGNVETTNLPAMAKLVDLDVAFQTGSQIWGAEIAVTSPSGKEGFQGKLQTSTLRDLWFARAPGGFAAGFGGVFQSVMTNVVYNLGPNPSVLNELKKATGNVLSIKFVLYAYDATVAASPTFAQGKIVGTIGPHNPSEPTETVAARRLISRGGDAFGSAPFKVNASGTKVVIDLGNAVPEISGGGSRVSLGTMQAQIILPKKPPVDLGVIDYSQAHYETTAGIEEVPITASQANDLRTNPLGVNINKPSSKLVLSETPDGSHLAASSISFRMEPTGPGAKQTVELIATKFGLPKKGQKLRLMLNGGSPATALKFPGTVTTGSDGKASVQFDAGDPGGPRGTDLDGQVYVVGFFWEDAVPTQLRGLIHVKVFDLFTPPKNPASADVLRIFKQYARLYPFMKARLDLSDLAAVKSNIKAIKDSMSVSLEDPRYMPVTRDLSERKRKMILDWLNAGAP